MIIEESDFRLTPDSEGSHFWNLELLKTIKPKGKECRQELVQAGWGLTLPSAIRRIANFRVGQKHPEESLTMKQYLREFQQIINDLSKTCSENI